MTSTYGSHHQMVKHETVPLVYDRLLVSYQNNHFEVSAESIRVTSGSTYSMTWDRDRSMVAGGVSIMVRDGRYLTVQPSPDITLVITRHPAQLTMNKITNLEVRIENGEGFFDIVDGILGKSLIQYVNF